MATKAKTKEARRKVFESLKLKTVDEVVAEGSFGLPTVGASPTSMSVMLMPKSRKILADLSVSLSGAGAMLVGYDYDDTGADDWAGHLMEYSGEAINSILSDGELPPLPEFLSYGLDGKLGMQGKFALLSVKIGLGFAQNQLVGHPKVETTFKYINKAINCLLAGCPVPAAPPALASAN